MSESFITYFCHFTPILIVAYMIFMVRQGLKTSCKRLRIKPHFTKTLLTYSSLGLIFWILIISFLSYLNFFKDFTSFPPRIAFAFIPPLILIIYLTKNRFFKLMLRTVSEKSLIFFQTFRIVIELMFYLLYTISLVPFQMTFLGFNHDIMVGITALIAGNLFFMKRHRQQVAAILWNITGIIMLINIVTITALSSPFPYRVFMNDPSSEIIATFPYILIPGFIVPMAIGVHIFSIRQLILNGK